MLYDFAQGGKRMRQGQRLLTANRRVVCQFAVKHLHQGHRFGIHLAERVHKEGVESEALLRRDRAVLLRLLRRLTSFSDVLLA